ncbi:Pcf11 [Drosophila busckii]|uniref:Pre-mRNA cleavage complex 2 protein Pcf11 n=1 Tax=Drosophila busckii TaxID=30019 RepID=A0A0M4ED75_DROBS|nr:uncharacterized protein LOC108596091 isoform X2 [Drosophila busckii]ALC41827.1 Pcf11 [Drosophila busckii]
MDHILQTYPEDARRIGEEYLSSLTDLNCNSKPLINMLTMLAEENINYAQVIVRVVEFHISQVPAEFKLPILYLIDSIIKNVKSSYVQMFGQCIVNIFTSTFESVPEKVRERMYQLRQTWNEVFPPSRMYALDVKVKRLDNNWPITAKPSQPTKIHVNPAIHVNPDFLKTGMVPVPVSSTLPSEMEEILQAKTRELLELKKRKLELELEQTKLHLKEQERQLSQATDAMAVAPIAMPAPVAPLRPPGLENVPLAAPLYPPGLHNVRPQAPIGVPPAMLPTVNSQSFGGKPKVHPINPAMLNSVRQRDPRLARQQQLLPMSAPARDPRLDSHKSSSHKSSRSRSKSPSRNAGISRSSKSSSSNHHSSSSSSRKRSESKSSTSSSGSDNRHKGSSSSSSSLSPVKRASSSRDKTSKTSSSSERYGHHSNGGSGSSPSTSKRKSSSPSSSPAKSKRSGSSHKTSTSSSRHAKSKTRSRSRSPIYRDVDMRSKSPEPAKTSTKISSAATSDSVPASAPVNAINANDLEKPTATTVAVNVKQSSPPPGVDGNVSDTLQQSISKLLHVAEKRSASELPADAADDDEADDKLLQPQQKRSKSSKLDALFGSEDVDLRRVLPAKTSGMQSLNVIVVEDDSMDNWDNKQTTKSAGSPGKKPSLDDIRAKLAKSVRSNNKHNKIDKSTEHPVAQRLRQLAELKSNDDSQEAHDEKMRTILSQAQEMYENHNMNQEQYKDLVSKVVAINESSKHKDPRRRDAEESEFDVERNAARDAVLRKRIPKLKGNENQAASSSPRSDGYEEQQQQQQQEKTQPMSKQQKLKRDGKRRKPSKWGEQLDPAAAQRAAWQQAQSNNNNNNNINNNGNNNNKRLPQAGGAFRAMPWQHPPLVVAQQAAPPPPQPPNMMAMAPVSVPGVPAITKAINSLDNPMADVVRSITIDGGSKEIRFYNQVAVIFMDGDEPHEIGFQHGQRHIYIDHNEPLLLSFNDDYKPFQLDGQLHRIRFGHPSRELYIDEHWYEIYFGGPPVSLPIGNKLHVLKAEGPPPNVDIGRVRRDLVVGKINMIVDAHTIVPLFLDGRQQTFLMGAEQHSLQFVDSFLYALLDGQLQKLEYGGLPKSMKLNGGRCCFIRFGTLPKGVQAGKAHVQDMVYIKTEPPAEPPQPPALPVPTPKVEAPAAATTAAAPAVPLPIAAAALGNLNIDELFQKLVSSGIIGTAAGATGSVNVPPVGLPGLDTPVQSKEPTAVAAAAAASPALPTEPIKRIDLQKPDTIKTRQAAVVATLYLGMQCSSCGVRFPPEQTIKYSQHLDWHFRQNRRERDSTRKATSRRWFYDLNDWRQYEEIEDVEERERNFAEAQGQQAGPDAHDDLSQQRSMDSPIPSCAAGTDDVDRCCDMCHEKFEQFYNEELEEWHLRSAMRVDDKFYHPLCYEDYKSSLNPPAPATENKDTTHNTDVEMLNASDDNAMDTLIKVEQDTADVKATLSSTLLDDDDDDVIVLPNEEPSVTEIVDDDDDDDGYVAPQPKPKPTEAEDNEQAESLPAPSTAQEQQPEREQQKAENANESDVEIQEPNIPFTDLDNYVEKEPMPLLNIKIKEEPKDDDEEDEDDGFEDVGTVVTLLPLLEDEISINSSETQTQTIDSSASPATIERPASVASLSLPGNDDELETEPAPAAATVSSEADFNGENQQDTHNLSAAGLTPALPLASIVNKIKINITKNTSSNSHNSASTTTTAAPTAATDSQVSAISVIGANGHANVQQQQPPEQNAIQTISTIPVLCGGNTFVPKIATSSSANAPPANICTISVIGSSYGSSKPANPITSSANSSSSGGVTASSTLSSSKSASSSSKTTTAAAAPPAAAIETEPEPVVELKPALRNVMLKKTKKVQNGIETSGLCSIM